MTYLKHLAAAAFGLLSLTGAVAAQDLDAGIEAAVADLTAHIGGEEAAGSVRFLTDAPTGVTADTLGHLMFIRRHFDRAAFFFALEATADPDASTLNNLSTMLEQVWADDPETWPAAWLDTALAASRRAVELAPDNAVYHNNLGNVARRLGLHDEAVAAHRRAVDLAPDEPLYWANLARALDAAGDTAAAADALAEAHRLSPNAPAVRYAMRGLAHGEASTAAYDEAIRRNCEVDFRCQEICPKSIIGGLMSVTCEMENSSAQMACQAGQPYPTDYDCAEDFPKYGIMIPGLNAGFSIVVPGFSAHVKVDGEGNVDMRVEAGVQVGPVEAHAGFDGHYSNETGGVSADNMQGGVRIVVLPKNANNLDVGSNFKIPVTYTQVPGGGGSSSVLDVATFNRGDIAN